jgi:hypothetical protein
MEVALHAVDPQLPASAFGGETIAGKRNATNKMRWIIFIVGIVKQAGCRPSSSARTGVWENVFRLASFRGMNGKERMRKTSQ